MPEVIISALMLMLLLNLNKILRQFKFYILSVFIVSLIVLVSIKAFNINYKLVIMPIVFLIIYQPLRLLFKWILKREPIVNLRGMNLTQQEKDSINALDYLYAVLLFFIPLISPAFSFI